MKIEEARNIRSSESAKNQKWKRQRIFGKFICEGRKVLSWEESSSEI